MENNTHDEVEKLLSDLNVKIPDLTLKDFLHIMYYSGIHYEKFTPFIEIIIDKKIKEARLRDLDRIESAGDEPVGEKFYSYERKYVAELCRLYDEIKAIRQETGEEV